MIVCKAIIQEGANKGNRCTRHTENTHGYCGKHLRVKQYDDGIAEGIRWCRYFFRGCNNTLASESVTCNSCLDLRKKQTPQCKHAECKFASKPDSLFCGKHQRDKYRLEEIEKGIRYCNIDRGCFAVCREGYASCDACLDTKRQHDNARLAQRKTINKQLRACHNDIRVCQNCGKEFTKFATAHGADSTKCNTCYEAQKRAEEDRCTRNRNYKEEKLNHIKSYFKRFTFESHKRGYDVRLTFEEYKDLVTKPCYYCNYYSETEAIGIDRVNNSLHYYAKDNCVPCCEACNRIKHIYHPLFLVEKANIVAQRKVPTVEFYAKWSTYYTRSVNNLYSKYKKEAEGRNLTFLLSELEWDRLIRQPCYLCNYRQSEGIGLDRFDNGIRSYTLENSRPCCGSCNMMKHYMPHASFVAHMTRIA